MSNNNNNNTLIILIDYNNTVIALNLPETANVFDLKRAIQEKTGVKEENQTLFGLEMSMQDLTNDLPIFALGITSGQQLLLINDAPVTKVSSPEKKQSTSASYNPPTSPYSYSSYDDVDISSSKPSTTPGDRTAFPVPRLEIGRFLNLNDFKRLLDLVATDEDEFTSFFEIKYGVLHPSFIGNQFTTLFEDCKAKKRLMIVFLYGDNIATKDFCS